MTSVVNHLLFYVKENQFSPTYSSLNFFIFLSLQFSNIKKNNIFLFSGTESHTKLKFGLHMNSRLMYCILESGCWCLFIPLFLQFCFSQIPKH